MSNDIWDVRGSIQIPVSGLTLVHRCERRMAAGQCGDVQACEMMSLVTIAYLLAEMDDHLTRFDDIFHVDIILQLFLNNIFRKQILSVVIDNENILFVQQYRYPGTIIEPKLTWHVNTEPTVKTTFKTLYNSSYILYSEYHFLPMLKSFTSQYLSFKCYMLYIESNILCIFYIPFPVVSVIIFYILLPATILANVLFSYIHISMSYIFLSYLILNTIRYINNTIKYSLTCINNRVAIQPLTVLS